MQNSQTLAENNRKVSQEAWSLVFKFTKPPDESLETDASTWFLVGDEPHAPNHLLYPGSRFDLFEGHRLVARGEVVE